MGKICAMLINSVPKHMEIQFFVNTVNLNPADVPDTFRLSLCPGLGVGLNAIVVCNGHSCDSLPAALINQFCRGKFPILPVPAVHMQVDHNTAPRHIPDKRPNIPIVSETNLHTCFHSS